MLKKIRKNIKVIMWIILITFVLWGAGTTFTAKTKQGSAKYAGMLFGKRVSFDEYSKALRAVEIQSLILYGQDFQKAQKMLDLKMMAWNNLMLIKEAKRIGIKVSNKEMIARISQFSFFQRNGQFDYNLYKTLLEQVFRITAADFEDVIRQLLMVMKLQENVITTVTISDKELEDEYQRMREERKVSYVVLSQKNYVDAIQVTDEKLRNYYTTHLEELKLPDRVNVEYIGITYAQLKDNIKVSDDNIMQYYNQNKSQFIDSNTNQAMPLTDQLKENIKNYLFIKEAKKEAKSTMNKVFNDLVENENFNSTATKFLLPIKETGLFSADGPVPGMGIEKEFIDAAFQLEKEQATSEIVYANKGAYILRLKEKNPSHVPTFEEIKETVKERFLNEEAKIKAKEVAEDMLNKLKVLLREGLSFKDSIAKLNLTSIQSGYFTRLDYVKEIGPAPNFVETSFKLNVGQISNVIEIADGCAIIQLDEIKPVDTEAFQKDKENFKKFALEQKYQSLLKKFLNDLKQKANLISYVE